MKKDPFVYAPDGLSGMDVPEPENSFETDMSIYGGMTQEEIEAEADREEEEERKKEFEN